MHFGWLRRHERNVGRQSITHNNFINRDYGANRYSQAYRHRYQRLVVSTSLYFEPGPGTNGRITTGEYLWIARRHSFTHLGSFRIVQTRKNIERSSSQPRMIQPFIPSAGRARLYRTSRSMPNRPRHQHSQRLLTKHLLGTSLS